MILLTIFQTFKGATSDIFSHFIYGLIHGKSVGKPKNNSLLWKKNAKGVILIQKGTMIADGGKDWNGLEMTILKNQIH